MYCLQIFLIFLLFLITFSIHVPSLHSKPYREIKLHLNKSNHIINRNILWPSTWIRNENNWKLHSFIAYRNRKLKEQANQSRFKKIKLIHTNNIQPNLDTRRNQFGHDNLKKSTLSIHLYQERKLSKFDQGSQQNQNTVKIQIFDKLPCAIPKWVNQKEIGISLPIVYFNPCQPDPGRHCEFIYKNFILKDKFIQCDKSGKAIVKSCPQNCKFDSKLQECSYSYTLHILCQIPSWVNQSETGTELLPFQINPCYSDITRKCEYEYIRYKYDDTKFIQCDKSGNAIIKSCPPSFKWDDKSNQCSLKTTMIITSTEKSTIFSSKNTVQDLTKTDTRGTIPPCLIPDWDNQTDNGTELPPYFLNPCHSDIIQKCEYKYIRNKYDDTKFIRCDKSGNAIIKSCPPSFKWEDKNNQCSLKTTTMMMTSTEESTIFSSKNTVQDLAKTDTITAPESTSVETSTSLPIKKLTTLPTSTEIKVETTGISYITSNINTRGTNSPCLIPDWDNQTDNGTELPSYYLNPCKSQPTNNCKFNYMPFHINYTKFIQCDKFGNARLKSCPTSFKWDKGLNECLSEAVITTNPPCLIPDWDNQTDNGTELPSYYPNPCMSQSTNNCKFNYKSFYIDDTKFIQCDEFGNARVKLCPTSFRWDNTGNRCLLEIITTMKIPCLIPSGVNQTEKASHLPHIYPNPCTKDLSRSCEFSFKPFLLDPHKFIKCDKFGKASLKSCQVSFRWFQTVQQCLPQTVTTFTPQCQIPAWVNQNEHGTPLPSFYPNPCIAAPNRICLFIYKQFLLDQHKFILCDKDGHGFVKSCPPNFKWVVHDQKCSIENIQSTINPQCEVPAWVNKKEKGEPLESFYPNPCLADLSRNCEFIYLLYILDKHKFIQCDRFGNAVKKSCPLHNIWNNHIKQCSIQNIMTTIRPTCPVPNWMNPNEMRLTLPSYLPNPCNSTSIQTCKYFTYVKDDNKFIECDQYGKAWVKSCPPISRWDTIFKKCTAIING